MYNFFRTFASERLIMHIIMKNSKIYSVAFILWLFVAPMYAQSLMITEEFRQIPMASVLTLYKNQFGQWEKPDLEDTFPYAVFRVGLEGNERAVTLAKQRLNLYMGQMSGVLSIYKDNPNEILFLVPARHLMVYIECGDGCERQLLMDLQHLKSNAVYYGKVHYIPAEASSNEVNIDSLKQQLYEEFEAHQQAQAHEPKNNVNGILSEYEDNGLQKTSFEINGVSFTMIKVEGGEFVMGATKEQGNASSDEIPTHHVQLSDYYIGETEVTRALWDAVMSDTPTEVGAENYPISGVSWDDCQLFITKLRILTGRDFRLPTEAEWEYAARGGNRSKGYKYAGSDLLDEVAWHRDNSDDIAHFVAQKKPNELGLYDMSGGVYECCQDWYGAYSTARQKNPKGPSFGTHRVYRGGSRNNYYIYCRISYRSNNTPNARYRDLGLRLVLEP